MSLLDDNSWTVVKRYKNVHVRDKRAAENVKNVKFTGHGIKELEDCWAVAVNTFFARGGELNRYRTLSLISYTVASNEGDTWTRFTNCV
jgi:hypothetical protein